MASDPKKPYGDVKYADPGYQSDGKKRYPLDSEEHCKAAWSYINQEKNAAQYTPSQLRLIKGRIKAAGKRYGIVFSDDDRSHPPTDNLVRALVDERAVQLREDTGVEGRTLFGHFAVFDEWTEIESTHEGHFLERIAPGAFARTFTNRRDKMKVLYDHGKDPQLGNKPLGTIRELREDEHGAYYEVDLLPVPYNDEFVIPAAKAGLLGASFRFSVPDDGELIEVPMRGHTYNPGGLPERTITHADVFEFGPVTFPAYTGADVGLRSGTDDFISHLLSDPRYLARFTERAGLAVVERVLAAAGQPVKEPVPPSADEPAPPDAPADGHTSTPTDWDARRAFARRRQAAALGVGKR